MFGNIGERSLWRGHVSQSCAKITQMYRLYTTGCAGLFCILCLWGCLCVYENVVHVLDEYGVSIGKQRHKKVGKRKLIRDFMDIVDICTLCSTSICVGWSVGWSARRWRRVTQTTYTTSHALSLSLSYGIGARWCQRRRIGTITKLASMEDRFRISQRCSFGWIWICLLTTRRFLTVYEVYDGVFDVRATYNSDDGVTTSLCVHYYCLRWERGLDFVCPAIGS